MRGKVGLHDDLAWQTGASRAAGDLHQQRREALRGAEVRAVQRVVGAQHAHQRQPRKVVALREHLRADEDVELVRGHPLAHVGERVPRPRAVAVDACDARPGKRGRQRALEPLRAEAERHQVDVAALGTRTRHALRMSAVMAAQERRVAMRGEARAAARARRFPPARGADQRRREAAAIHEDQRLLAAREAFRDGRAHRLADAVERAGRAIAGQRDVRQRGARIGALAADRGAGSALRVHAATIRATASRCPARRARRAAARARSRRRARDSARCPAACTTQSCSSSTTMSPSAGSGANTASRVPSTSCAAPARRGLPLRAPLAVGQCAVQRRDAQSRARRAHARDELRRQVDLGHQQQHLPRRGRARRRRRRDRRRSCRCR